ncbi:hypothetical protein CAL7716_049600 [Calothrix sp. PCC 7716]|nr:hypothetical protein CAL7716_049600 [Calothrix sp. PCC 7716]
MIKFTPAGGSIEVTLNTVDSYAIIQVSDTGIGIGATESVVAPGQKACAYGHLEQITYEF